MQERLIGDDPETFFRPSYVSHHGWIGERTDLKPDWNQVADLCEDAYRAVAPARLAALLDD